MTRRSWFLRWGLFLGMMLAPEAAAFGQGIESAKWSFAFSPDHCASFDGSGNNEAAPVDTDVGTYNNGFPTKGFIKPSHGGALESGYLLCPIMYPSGFTGVKTLYTDLLWSTASPDATKYVRWQTDLVFTNWGGKTGEYVKSDDSTVTDAWEEAQTSANSLSGAVVNSEILTRTGQTPYIFSYNGGNTPPSEGQLCSGITCAAKHGVLRIQRVPATATELNATTHLVWVTVWIP